LPHAFFIASVIIFAIFFAFFFAAAIEDGGTRRFDSDGNGIVEAGEDLFERQPDQLWPVLEIELAPFKPHQRLEDGGQSALSRALQHDASDHVVATHGLDGGPSYEANHL
jgi:hypothetical protein